MTLCDYEEGQMTEPTTNDVEPTKSVTDELLDGRIPTSLMESALSSDYEVMKRMVKEHEIALRIVADTEANMHTCFEIDLWVSGIAFILAFCALLLGLS